MTARIPALKREVLPLLFHNVGTGSAYTVLEVAQLFESLLGREIQIVELDGAESADRIHLEADISRITEEIGWSPKFSLPDAASQLLGPGVTETE